MEPAKQVPNERGTMPQHHAWVGLHRLATLRLQSTPNNEACCAWVPLDLLRRWHLRTTSSTGSSLQLAAETKLEIMKSKRQQQQQQNCSCIWLLSFLFSHLLFLVLAMMATLLGVVLKCHLVIYERNADWYIVFASLLFRFVYGMDVICRGIHAPTSCLFSRWIFI